MINLERVDNFLPRSYIEENSSFVAERFAMGKQVKSLFLIIWFRQFSCRKLENLEDFITKNIHQFEGTFGVLLFLYSILLSKVKLHTEKYLQNQNIDL